jgi:hypothetical protein
LAWLIQANYFQRQMPYQLVPPIFLGLALLADVRSLLRDGQRLLRQPALCTLVVSCCAGFAIIYGIVLSRIPSVWNAPEFNGQVLLPLLLVLTALAGHPDVLRGFIRMLLSKWRLALVILFCLGTLATHPFLHNERWQYWGRCLQEGSTPEIRDRLTVEKIVTATDWEDLQKVKEYLKTLHLQNRELTCYALSSVPLYQQMNLEAPTRFVLLWADIKFFPEHEREIAKELEASPERYIVNDLRQWDVKREEVHRMAPGRPFGLPKVSARAARLFPWTEPVVFRSGRYLVHRVVTLGPPSTMPDSPSPRSEP